MHDARAPRRSQKQHSECGQVIRIRKDPVPDRSTHHRLVVYDDVEDRAAYGMRSVEEHQRDHGPAELSARANRGQRSPPREADFCQIQGEVVGGRRVPRRLHSKPAPRQEHYEEQQEARKDHTLPVRYHTDRGESDRDVAHGESIGNDHGQEKEYAEKRQRDLQVRPIPKRPDVLVARRVAAVWQPPTLAFAAVHGLGGDARGWIQVDAFLRLDGSCPSASSFEPKLRLRRPNPNVPPAESAPRGERFSLRLVTAGSRPPVRPCLAGPFAQTLSRRRNEEPPALVLGSGVSGTVMGPKLETPAVAQVPPALLTPLVDCCIHATLSRRSASYRSLQELSRNAQFGGLSGLSCPLRCHGTAVAVSRCTKTLTGPGFLQTLSKVHGDDDDVRAK